MLHMIRHIAVLFDILPLTCPIAETLIPVAHFHTYSLNSSPGGRDSRIRFILSYFQENLLQPKNFKYYIILYSNNNVKVSVKYVIVKSPRKISKIHS